MKGDFLSLALAESTSDHTQKCVNEWMDYFIDALFVQLPSSYFKPTILLLEADISPRDPLSQIKTKVRAYGNSF
jgi:hypothetical protein